MWMPVPAPFPCRSNWKHSKRKLSVAPVTGIAHGGDCLRQFPPCGSLPHACLSLPCPCSHSAKKATQICSEEKQRIWGACWDLSIQAQLLADSQKKAHQSVGFFIRLKRVFTARHPHLGSDERGTAPHRLHRATRQPPAGSYAGLQHCQAHATQQPAAVRSMVRRCHPQHG